MTTINPMPEETQRYLIALAGKYPSSEICGFILRGWKIHPIKNQAKEGTEFSMADADVLDAYQRHHILGVYHSHPGGRQDPSNVDLQYAPHNDRYWIITPNDVIEWDMSNDPPRRLSA